MSVATLLIGYLLTNSNSAIIAQYIYYDAGNKPTAEDIERSETLEGRLREGFVRIRQLMVVFRPDTL